MSVLSPAERAIRITLSVPSSRIWAMVMTRRPSSTWTSTGTSARSAICSSGVMTGKSLDQVNGVLAQFVDCVDHLGVGFVAALVDDQVGKFGGHIHRGRFHRAAFHRSASSSSGKADRRKRGERTELIVVVAYREEGVRISNGGHGQLANHGLISVGELRQNLAVRANADSRQ